MRSHCRIAGARRRAGDASLVKEGPSPPVDPNVGVAPTEERTTPMRHDPGTPSSPAAPPPAATCRPRGRRGLRRLVFGGLAVLGVVGAASMTASAAGSTVDALSTASFGTVLTDAQGFALYTLPTDQDGMSSCTGACVAVWPALTVASGTTPTAGPGVNGTVAAVVQSNGTSQVTYNGSPLYTFVGDTAAGQVTGNNVGGFKVAQVAAAPPTTTAPPTTAPAAAASPSPSTPRPVRRAHPRPKHPPRRPRTLRPSPRRQPQRAPRRSIVVEPRRLECRHDPGRHRPRSGVALDDGRGRGAPGRERAPARGRGGHRASGPESPGADETGRGVDARSGELGSAVTTSRCGVVDPGAQRGHERAGPVGSRPVQ